MPPLYTLCLVVAAVALSGCASVNPLNDPTRSRIAADVANVEGPRDILYESQEKGGLEVSYSLSFYGKEELPGYRLNLIFRNKGDLLTTVEPRVYLRDASGFVIEPSTYSAYAAYASALAGTPVPSLPTVAAGNYYHSGTVTSTSGDRYSYSGYTSSVPSGGFLQGYAQGAAIRAANASRDGLTMLRWANQYWLKDGYFLLGGAAASGALYFPANAIGKLPLSLTVSVGSDRFDFKTISAAK